MDSPYAPPLSPPGPLPAAPAVSDRPKAIRFFGVTNLIIAGISSLYILVVFYNVALQIAHYGIGGTGLPLWQTGPMIVITTALAALMIIAGLKLIRSRRDAIQAASRYAIASICGKIVLVPLMVLPNMGIEHFSDVSTRDIAIIAALFLLLVLPIASAYPILCLILLKRSKVRDWLTVSGT